MSRVKTGTTRRARHKKIRKAAKGFTGHRGRTVRGAKEGVVHALKHAYKSRRLKKRDFRALWIERINAAVRERDLSYSQLIALLKKKNVELNRKILSQLAVEEAAIFDKIVAEVK